MSIQTVGDPHLGRVFKNNVPLHRRGERERMVRQAFAEAIRPKPGVTMVLIMGDIFDAPQVPYEVLWHAYGILNDAASNHPKVEFFVIQGNHDESRDLHEITAWNLLGLLCAEKANIRLVTDPLVLPDHRAVILPWSPRRTAIENAELVRAELERSSPPITKAYGHWDLDARSAHWNLIPLKELRSLGITEVWTGHIHKPTAYAEKGIDVNVVGSLQPYAHGEDGGQGDVRYLTLTSDVLADTDLLDLVNACVRLVLEPGEPVPAAPDCLQWQVERKVEGEDEGEAFGVELTLDGFEVGKVYAETMDEAGDQILPAVREKIDQRWAQTFSENS